MSGLYFLRVSKTVPALVEKKDKKRRGGESVVFSPFFLMEWLFGNYAPDYDISPARVSFIERCDDGDAVVSKWTPRPLSVIVSLIAARVIPKPDIPWIP